MVLKRRKHGMLHADDVKILGYYFRYHPSPIFQNATEPSYYRPLHIKRGNNTLTLLKANQFWLDYKFAGLTKYSPQAGKGPSIKIKGHIGGAVGGGRGSL